MGLTLVRFDDKQKAYLAAKGLHGTRFTCFTSTKVQILTQKALPRPGDVSDSGARGGGVTFFSYFTDVLYYRPGDVSGSGARGGGGFMLRDDA